ncbi:MAG: DUF4190 domain-containing protein [Planctomycetota bacterium]|jgi:hypothetical protein
MGEAENDTKEEKVRISKLAIVSLLLNIFGVFFWVPILYGFGIYNSIRYPRWMPFYLSPSYVYSHLVSGLMVIGGIAAGIVAIKQIRYKRRILKGRGFAISGLLIGVVFLVFWIWHSPNSPFTARKRCAANLRAIGCAMLIYTTGDYAMPAENWCDILIEFGNIRKNKIEIRKWLKCPAHKNGRCHYAINPNAPLRSPPDVVLLFESKDGWNQAGGKELLTVDNHGGKGFNIVFNDLHVEFVKLEDLDKLNWGNEQKQ